jgi:hypothetical protein
MELMRAASSNVLSTVSGGGGMGASGGGTGGGSAMGGKGGEGGGEQYCVIRQHFQLAPKYDSFWNGPKPGFMQKKLSTPTKPAGHSDGCGTPCAG